MDPVAGQHRRDYPRLPDPVGVADDVGIEHGQVGGVAGEQEAAAAVIADRVCSPGGEA